MTMMMTNSQFGLEDMEALLWGPSSPMADPLGSLLFHPDQQEPHKGGGTPISEGVTSPASSFSSSSPSSSTPDPFYSPPSSPEALLQEDKAGTESDMLSLAWLAHPDQLGRSQTDTADGKGDTFYDMDWMTERMDLSEFDLESLIGSCSPDRESPSSSEELLASLDCPIELDALPAPTLPSLLVPSPPQSLCTPPIATPTPSPASPDLSFIPPVEPGSHVDRREVPSPPPCVPEPQEELEIKSEPASPAPSSPPSPAVQSPPSPAYTLDLGSEVDVSEYEVKPVVATVVPQVPRIVLSLSPTRIVLLLAPKDEVGVTTTTVTTTPEIIQSSPPASTSPRSPRSRPYPDPKSTPSTDSVKVRSARGTLVVVGGGERAALKPPKDKKRKKMEQNKTAATRYRQKKRAEQEALDTEYTDLERRNIELTEKADSMAREIQYLKELMEEVRLARIKKGLGADL
ncbi:activating transcription factor 4b [Polymixia lowei]